MQKTKKEIRDIGASVQEIFLAGIGALAKTEEEGSKLFEQLVSEGRSYDGPGAEQLEAFRQQVEPEWTEAWHLAEEVQSQAGEMAKRAWEVITQQVERARGGGAEAAEALESQVESAVARALQSSGVPTRQEFEALRESLQRLTSSLDGTEGRRAAAPPIEARPTGGDMFEIVVHDVVVDRVRGRKNAEARVEQLQRQEIAGKGGAGEISVEATGGGWYEVRLDGVAVDKVQGRRAAEAAVMRIKQQGQ